MRKKVAGNSPVIISTGKLKSEMQKSKFFTLRRCEGSENRRPCGAGEKGMAAPPVLLIAWDSITESVANRKRLWW